MDQSVNPSPALGRWDSTAEPQVSFKKSWTITLLVLRRSTALSKKEICLPREFPEHTKDHAPKPRDPHWPKTAVLTNTSPDVLAREGHALVLAEAGAVGPKHGVLP